MLMWGWMWVADKPGTTARDLTLELVGMGGERELAFRLNGVVTDVTERVDRKRKELEAAQAALSDLSSKAEMIRDMVQMINLKHLDAQLGV